MKVLILLQTHKIFAPFFLHISVARCFISSNAFIVILPFAPT